MGGAGKDNEKGGVFFYRVAQNRMCAAGGAIYEFTAE
jgi:hypothetical protein